MNRPNLTHWLLIAGLISTCGCRPAATGRTPVANEARSVTLVAAEHRELERTITAFGSFLAREQATLSAKVPGRLESVAVDLGSPVKAGTPFARIESRDYEMRVRQAEAALAQALARIGLDPMDEATAVDPGETTVARQARAVFDEARANRDRIASLHKQGVLSQAELDTAAAAFTVAENRFLDALEDARQRIAIVRQRRIERDMAAQQLADTALVAPFNASVQERTASPGEYLRAGDPVVTLVQMDPLRLQLEITERDAPLVQLNQLMRARVEGIDREHVGRITRISPAIDQQRRVLLVEADITNDGTLHPGMFARGGIVVNPNEPAVTVPASAVATFAGIEKVYSVVEGQARERVITTGRRGPDWVEVVTNLQAGESVVRDARGLQNGQPVIPAPPAAAQSDPTKAPGSTTPAS